MAQFDIVYTAVSARNAYGGAVDALDGSAAAFLSASVTASADVQLEAARWIAPSDGVVVVFCDAPGWLRVCPKGEPAAGDGPAAARGAAWPVDYGRTLILFVREGESLRAAGA